MDTRLGKDRRHYAVCGLMGFGFLIASFSQAKVQVIDRDKVLEEANSLSHFDIAKTEPARRGTIFSADGKVLAQTEDTYELGLNYAKIPDTPGFFVSLSEASGIAATELSARPSKQRGRVWRTPLSTAQADKVRTVRRRWAADGVSLERSNQRNYPMSEAIAGIVGTLREGEPISGIEKSQQTLLAGREGRYRGFIDRSGMFVVDEDAKNQKRQNGADLVLTIDSSLQTAAVQALRIGVESNKAKSGCAVVVDPKTGDLLAVANWPTYDPDASWKPGDDYNMAYMGAYEPGSTFKILTLAKGLDDAVVSPSDRFVCNGQIKVSNWTIHCADHGGHRAHGNVDVETAIAKSCNVAAANWALKIGRKPMIGFMDHLGLFEKTDVGLPYQRSGIFNRKDYAQRLQLATVGFGQSMGCVPINLAAAYAMLANDGKMMKPRLVKSVGEDEVKPQERGQMVTPETAHAVMRMMETVIQSDHGTGKALKIPGYRLAGKTGTAQKVGTSKGKYVANFVGMVPADSPRAVVLVMIDSPSAGDYYGGSVAGPVFVDISKAVIRRFGIPPSQVVGR